MGKFTSITLYFDCDYSRTGKLKNGVDDCEAQLEVYNSLTQTYDMNPCPNKQVAGMYFDTSEGEYGAMFVCWNCIKLLKQNMERV